jgi:hypothetical protein
VTTLITIEPHPDDETLVCLNVPQELNEAFGKFGPARLDPHLRRYVLGNDMIGALHKFLGGNKRLDAKAVDQRSVGSSAKGPRLLPVECAHCHQPARTTWQPKVCPACGLAWKPQPYVKGDDTGATRYDCPRGHSQTSRLPYCAECGAPMDLAPKVADDTRAEQLARIQDHARSVMEDPTHISELLAPLGATLVEERTYGEDDWDAYRAFWSTMRNRAARPIREGGPRPEIDQWDAAGRPATFRDYVNRDNPHMPPQPPVMPPRIAGRPVTDVPLPDAEVAHEPWDTPVKPTDEQVNTAHLTATAQAAIRHEPVPEREETRATLTEQPNDEPPF